MKIFDSHAHLHDKKFDADRDEMLARARAAGVRRMLTLGDNVEASRSAIALAEAHPDIIAAAGIHPHYGSEWQESWLEEIERLHDNPNVRVVGEIGLDYYWYKTEEEHAGQHALFREQLRLARRLGKPVSIHSRESDDDMIRILREEKAGEFGGVAHCFAGTPDQAREIVAMGLYIGAGGMATYKKNDAVRDMLRAAGPQAILLETDAPYLAPQPKRGKRNEPSFLTMTAESVAETLGMEAEELAEVAYRNTMKCFRLRNS